MHHQDWQFRDRLHRAAETGDLGGVDRLLAEGCDVNAFDEHLGRTPLHYAAKEEHFAVAKRLLEAGADVNAHHEPSIGETPLGLIAATCSPEMAELLLKAGADPSIPGWMQVTALYRASQRKKEDGVEVYNLMLKYGKKLRRGHAV